MTQPNEYDIIFAGGAQSLSLRRSTLVTIPAQVVLQAA
jgi:hypothetical protein